MDDPAPDVPRCALFYHESGWPPLELPRHAKGPPPEGRTGYTGTDMTEAEVRGAGWAGNVGVRMPVDVIALDVDAYRGGLETFKELEVRLGKLPPTWISHNGRNDGSGIRFFRVPVGMTWIASLAGIDILQRGHRYAVVWPSMHPDGRRYGWWDQQLGGPFEAIPLVENLPDLPWSWIAELSRPTSADQGGPASAATGPEVNAFLDANTGDDAPGYLKVILDHWRERVEQGWSRHDTTQHCLLWAMECVRAQLAPARPTVQSLADLWAEALASDPRRAELWSTRRTTEFTAMLRHAVGKITAKPQAELDKLHDDIAGVRLGIEPPLSVIDVDQDLLLLVDWTGTTDPEGELVEGLIIPGRWTQFVGKAKEGKSSLSMFLAVELSDGRHPLDGTPVAPIPVLYCDGEMGERDLRELIEACGRDPAKLTNLHCSTERVRLDTDRGAARLLRRVDELGVRLVVLDGLNGFVNPEASENDDKTWRPFYERTVQPLKARGVALVSGDNMGKDTTKGSRGSSVKNDKADAVFPVRRTDKGVKLRPSHRRGGNYTDELDLEAEGFDRTRPIRFWRTAMSVPDGTTEAIKTLDALGIPTGESRAKVRERLKAEAAAAEAKGVDPEPFRIRNDTLGAALRFRRQPVQVAGTASGTASVADSLFTPGTGPGTKPGNAP